MISPERKSQQREQLQESAMAVDATDSWQFLGGSHDDRGEFRLTAISRGPIHLVNPGNFGDIADNVTVNSDPQDESYRKVQFVEYYGQSDGLRLFIECLTGDLDRGAEGNIDMFTTFNGPLAVFSAIADRRLTGSGS